MVLVTTLWMALPGSDQRQFDVAAGTMQNVFNFEWIPSFDIHYYMGLDKSKHLYGSQLLEPGKPIVIVEACVDAIKTWQALAGKACIVASLGEGFSDTHVKTISSMRPPAVYIFTDGDSAGRLMANKIAHGLHGTVMVRIMECPWGPIHGYKDVVLGGRSIRKAIRPAVDPAILPADYINQLYDNAPVVRNKIKWTNPPLIYDPAVTQ